MSRPSQLATKAASVIPENGHATTAEVARRLLDQERVYVVIDGERSMYPIIALGQELANVPDLDRDPDGTWYWAG